MEFKEYGACNHSQEEMDFSKQAIVDLIHHFCRLMTEYEANINHEVDGNQSFKMASTLIMSFAASAFDIAHTKFGCDFEERAKDIDRLTSKLNKCYKEMSKEGMH